MSEVFEVCQANFYSNLRTAQKIIKSQEVSEFKISEATEALKEASEEFNKMSIEYSSNRDPAIKSKIALFKEQLRSYKRDLAKIENSFKESEQQQYSGSLMEADTEANEKGLNPLIDAKRQMYENQAISNEVAGNIQKNNEVLIRNINRMGDINNQLSKAHKFLDSIKNKLRKNKLIMWGTFGFLLLVLAIILYTYFRDDSHPQPSPAPQPTKPK